MYPGMSSNLGAADMADESALTAIGLGAAMQASSMKILTSEHKTIQPIRPPPAV